MGRLVPVRRSRISFRGAGVALVGKLTSPATRGRHPAIAIVHGSEASDREGSDLLVNFYSALGYVVLAYDKRGVGDSGGTYQEFPSPGNVQNLARDAVGALRALAGRSDVDAGRLGLIGGSQAGWIIPRVAAISPLVHFAVITSGPAVSVGEQGLYAGLTGQGATNPPQARIDQQLASSQPSGFDPRADLATLSIPTLWLFGREDKTVYVPETVAVLERLPTRPTIRVFPRAGHFVLDTPHGLSIELPRAHRFAPGFFTTISGWLSTH
jgi:pimeloyl-ACP methyl ester carboxylesterase